MHRLWLLIDDVFYRFQETETAAQPSLTEIKMQSLGTRESVRQSFDQELRKNQQEMANNYDQG